MHIVSKIYTLCQTRLQYKNRDIVLGTLPIRLWIESTLVCNLQCVMCPNKSIPNADKGHMSFELYTKIVDEAQGIIHHAHRR